MKGKFFLDTNILIYTFDQNKRSAQKRKRATELVETALDDNLGVISSQVIQEFLNVATRKFEKPLSVTDAESYLQQVLIPLCEIYPNGDLYMAALELREQYSFSFYDALIIAAARVAECHTLYSEDLQHGQKIGHTVISNPFE